MKLPSAIPLQVDHELSVPAVSTILLSMVLWAGGRGAGVLLAEEAPPQLRLHLASLAVVASIFVEIGVRVSGRL